MRPEDGQTHGMRVLVGALSTGGSTQHARFMHAQTIGQASTTESVRQHIESCD